jgi:hypothetical protein
MPTVNECSEAVARYAREAAAVVLKERGHRFEPVANEEDAATNLSRADAFLRENDFAAAAAVLLQNGPRLRSPSLEPALVALSRALRADADDLFYGRGESDLALLRYQLAVGLEPSNEQALHETIAPCLQGSPERPHIALPYAILVASLNPARDEVEYILARIAAG